jgi:hypothetical protein
LQTLRRAKSAPDKARKVPEHEAHRRLRFFTVEVEECRNGVPRRIKAGHDLQPKKARGQSFPIDL